MSAGNRRQRLFLLWLARIAIFAYAFQISALDHWHKDINRIEGVEGSSQHRYHCHADPSGCAEQPGFAGSLAEVGLVPLPPAPLAVPPIVWTQVAPGSAFIAGPDEPPRSS